MGLLNAFFGYILRVSVVLNAQLSVVPWCAAVAWRWRERCREEVAEGGGARRRMRKRQIDMLVECHRLDIFISDREIRFCASTPGLTTSAALYIATEAGGVSDCV